MRFETGNLELKLNIGVSLMPSVLAEVLFGGYSFYRLSINNMIYNTCLAAHLLLLAFHFFERSSEVSFQGNSSEGIRKSTLPSLPMPLKFPVPFINLGFLSLKKKKLPSKSVTSF